MNNLYEISNKLKRITLSQLQEAKSDAVVHDGRLPAYHPYTIRHGRVGMFEEDKAAKMYHDITKPKTP